MISIVVDIGKKVPAFAFDNWKGRNFYKSIQFQECGWFRQVGTEVSAIRWLQIIDKLF